MNKIPRPCRHGGCYVLTTEGYCDKHKPEANKRKSATARGYGYKWQKESKLYLAKHPYCAECMKSQRLVIATEVDHIIPHKGNQKLFWDRKNWQPLCHTCHSAKTAREDGGFGNR